MRFLKIIIFLLLGLAVATLAWAYPDPPEGTAYRVWGCTDSGIGGSWCNGGGYHQIFGWSSWVDDYNCSGTLITWQWANNYMSCITYGGSVGTCCQVMGTGIYPHDCFGYDPETGCGPIDYGDKHCGEIEDLRTQQMIDSGCCPLAVCPYPENNGRPSCYNSVDNLINVGIGNKYEESVDLTLSSSGIPIEFRRSYNSQYSSDGPLGYGWTHNFNPSLQVIQSQPWKRLVIWDSDGKGLYFYQVQQTSGEILFAGESGVKDRLKQVISTWRVLPPPKRGQSHP